MKHSLEYFSLHYHDMWLSLVLHARHVRASPSVSFKAQVANMKAMCIAAFLVSSNTCWAVSDKLAYELQERCGKQASAEFKREFGTGIDSNKKGTTVTTFRNHYSARLNACLYLLTASGFLVDTKGKASPPFRSQNLFDLNENREIGAFWRREDLDKPIQCQVNGQSCHSEVEFEALIKPLLEE